MLDRGKVGSRAELARQLAVSRAQVTQVLRLLQMAPSVFDKVMELEDPLDGVVLGAHTLRSLPGLSEAEQEARLTGLLRRSLSE